MGWLYTSVRVDGGARGNGISDKILDAGGKMKECHRILDRIDLGAFDILWHVTGLGKALSELRLSPRDLIWARAVLKASLKPSPFVGGIKRRTTFLSRRHRGPKIQSLYMQLQYTQRNRRTRSSVGAGSTALVFNSTPVLHGESIRLA